MTFVTAVMKDTSQALPWSLQAFFQAPPLSPEGKKNVWEVMGQSVTPEAFKESSFLLPSSVWVELKVLGEDS